MTPDPGPVFHKCLTPDPGPKEKRRILRDPVPSLVRSFTSVSKYKNVGNFVKNLVQHFPYVRKIVVEKYAKICQTKNTYANHLQKMPNKKMA